MHRRWKWNILKENVWREIDETEKNQEICINLDKEDEFCSEKIGIGEKIEEQTDRIVKEREPFS